MTIFKLALVLTSIISLGNAMNNARSSLVKPPEVHGQSIGSNSDKIIEAEGRLNKLKDLFKGRSPFDVAKDLNNTHFSSSPGQKLDEADTKDISMGPPLVLVVNSKVAVDTQNTKNIGQDISSVKNSKGVPILTTIIENLRAKSSNGIVRITMPMQITAESGPITKDVTIVAAGSDFLLGKKNTTGNKFLAYIMIP